jgi:biotin transport system permease protein
MAELTAFQFLPGGSVLHRLDPRFKLSGMIMLSLTGFSAGAAGLLVLTLLLMIFFRHARIPIGAALKEIRYFAAVLAMVFIARAFSTPGETLLDLRIASITASGLSEGALICWRLFFVVLLGLVFTATTRANRLIAATEWFLRPIPFLPAKRTAVMIGLIMRFIPVILQEMRKTSDAGKARGIENRKNPLYRITRLAAPAILRTFETADHLVAAMEARCFSENRVFSPLKASRADWLSFWSIAAVCLLVLSPDTLFSF